MSSLFGRSRQSALIGPRLSRPTSPDLLDIPSHAANSLLRAGRLGGGRGDQDVHILQGGRQTWVHPRLEANHLLVQVGSADRIELPPLDQLMRTGAAAWAEPVVSDRPWPRLVRTAKMVAGVTAAAIAEGENVVVKVLVGVGLAAHDTLAICVDLHGRYFLRRRKARRVVFFHVSSDSMGRLAPTGR